MVSCRVRETLGLLVTHFVLLQLLLHEFSTVGVAAASDFAAPLDEKVIRCKVCERAIQHVWHEGENLRWHCKDGDSTDPRCKYSFLHRFGIEEMVENVCDKLPTKYQAIHESEFDMVLSEDPSHPEHVAEAIRATCVKWVHEFHSVEEVAKWVFANLDVGKSTGMILHGLSHRFCHRACNPKYEMRLDAHDEF